MGLKKIGLLNAELTSNLHLASEVLILARFECPALPSRMDQSTIVAWAREDNVFRAWLTTTRQEILSRTLSLEDSLAIEADTLPVLLLSEQSCRDRCAHVTDGDWLALLLGLHLDAGALRT